MEIFEHFFDITAEGQTIPFTVYTPVMLDPNPELSAWRSLVADLSLRHPPFNRPSNIAYRGKRKYDNSRVTHMDDDPNEPRE